MSKSNAGENDVQAYLFGGVRPSWDGATELWLSLHTSDPGEAGNQGSSEAAYTGYARRSVARPGGFTVAGATATLAAQVVFGERTDAGPAQVCTHIGIGTSGSGPGRLLHSYALTSPISVEMHDSPYLPAGGLTVTED